MDIEPRETDEIHYHQMTDVALQKRINHATWRLAKVEKIKHSMKEHFKDLLDKYKPEGPADAKWEALLGEVITDFFPVDRHQNEIEECEQHQKEQW